MSKIRKAIAYLRLSPRGTQTEEEKAATLRGQEQAICDFARKNNLEIVETFKDLNKSGKDENRPGLWNAIEATKKGWVLVAFRWDRIARGVFLTESIQRRIDKQKAVIQTVEDNHVNEDTDEAKLLRVVTAAVWEFEAKITARRTSALMLARQRAGQRISGIPPFGKKLDPADNTRLIDNLKEQTTISAMTTKRNFGWPYREIARWLDETERDCRGRKWHHGTVKKILDREAGTKKDSPGRI